MPLPDRNQFVIDGQKAISIDKRLVPTPAFERMLALLNVEQLALSEAAIVPDESGAGFSITGRATLFGTTVSEVDLYFEPLENDQYEFQFSGVCASLNLRTLLARGILPGRRLEAAPQLLDAAFTAVELVFDSEQLTIYFGVAESPHRLDLFAPLGLAISDLGFELLRHDADNSALLVLHATLPLGETSIRTEIDLPLDTLLATEQWTLRFSEPVQLERGIYDLIHLLGQTSVGQEVGVASWDQAFPERLLQIPALFLNELEVKFSPQPLRLAYLAFSIDSTYPLALGSSDFVIDRLGFGLTILRWEGSTAIRLLLFGHIELTPAVLLGLSLDVPVTGQDAWLLSLQAQVSLGSLHDLNKLPVNTHVEEFELPADFLTLESFELRRFELAFQPSSGIESLDLAFDTQLTCRLGTRLALLNPAVTLHVDNPFNAQGITTPRAIIGSIRGSLLVGELVFELEADKTTGGWSFTGQASRLIRIDGVLQAIGQHFDVALPTLLHDFELTELMLRLQTTTSNDPSSQAMDLSFRCVGHLTIGDQQVAGTIDIAIHRMADGVCQARAQGFVQVADRQFALIFDHDPNANRLLASYVDLSGGAVNVGALLAEVTSEPEVLDATSGLEIGIKDALLAYVKPNTPPAPILFGADLGGGINLSHLPLVGQAFPAEQTLRLSFQPLIASQPLTRDEVARLRALVPSGGLALPDRDLAKGLALATQLQLGATPIDLNLPVTLDRQSGQLTDTSPNPGVPSTPTPPGSTPAPDGVSWIDLQKAFGPVHFERIGLRYRGGDLTFLLDAALVAAGLTLTLDGLAAAVALADLRAGRFAPSFALTGLGIGYRNDTVEIGGYLAHLRPEDTGGADEYDGEAVVRTSKLSLAAIGSYAEVEGTRSVFLYAVLDYPLGGPAFFFVTGLAAGFGFNRALRMPPIEQVASFPLVAEALKGAGSAPMPSPGPAQRQLLSSKLRDMRQYLPITAGEHFLAVGIRFTSFRQIDSFALLSVSFGQHVEIDLLGLSTAIIPSPDAGRAVPPVAEIQLALKATFLPDEGVLSVLAQLTNSSYLFSRDCHLTGGFAFVSWFKGPHSGDFVLTVGGYHPSYRPPAHYPQVPRLAFNWQVTNELSIKGDAYFALTAHALMAGAHLQAIWQSGALRAWFNAGADFLLAWKPYHYEASLYVNIGVSYTFEFFGTQHITVELGADLSIWGPEFSGIAHIHLWIVSFTITFGQAAARQAIDWMQFRTSFLPHTPDGKTPVVCSIAAERGMGRKLSDEQGELWIVNPKELILTTNSVIPATAADLGGHRLTALAYRDEALSQLAPITAAYFFDVEHSDRAALLAFLQEHEVAVDPTATDEQVRTQARVLLATLHGHQAAIAPIGVGPMALHFGAVTTTQRISITRDGNAAADMFTYTPVLKRAPVALWGEAIQPDLNGRSFIDNTLAGFELRPRVLAHEHATHAIPRTRLQFDTELVTTDLDSPASHFVPASDQGRTLINDQIESPATATARAELLRGLGFDPAIVSPGMSAIGNDFLFAPQIGQMAE
jgi:hypothetical protein